MGFIIGISRAISGKRSQKTMERSTMLNGKTHYFGHFQ